MLIARNGALLDELSARVASAIGVEARPLVQDLTAPDVGARVAEATDGLDVGLLIYNAGAANRTTEFLDDSFDHSLKQIKLECIGPVALVRPLRTGDARTWSGRHRAGRIAGLPGRIVVC